MRSIACTLLFGLAVAYPTRSALAQGESTRTIVGQVSGQTSERYLHRVRISVEGTSIETFTDESGNYRLRNVPAGGVTLRAFYTGLEEQTVTVDVPPTGTVRQDFELARLLVADGVVELDAFTVAANREYNARAIALNEQRFAANVKHVVSTDEFGDIGENDIGEFVKFLPGVAVNTSNGIISTGVAVRGFPPVATQLTLDGGEVAGAGVGNPNRGNDVYLFPTMNNISRVEVIKTPTPDRPANMIGGAVNLISRSAFEYRARKFTYRAAGIWNSASSGYPAPNDEKAKRIGPSVDFQYTDPVSERFGYTINGSYYSRQNESNNASSFWDLTNHHLDRFQISLSPQIRTSISTGGGFDYKIGDRGVLSGKLSYSEYDVTATTYILDARLQGGSGDETSAESNGNRGRIFANTLSTPIHNQTWHGTLNFRNDGEIWKLHVITSYSSATGKRRSLDEDTLTNIQARHFNVFTRFDDIGRTGPGSITSIDEAGNPIDILDVNDYRLVSARDFRRNNLSTKLGSQADLSRTFDLNVPVTLKTGVYYNQVTRDSRSLTTIYTFRGPDGIGSNADNRVGLYDFLNEREVPGAYGTPALERFLSAKKVTAYFRENPEQFTSNPAATYTNGVNNSKKITETITATYLRGDVRLLSNRLWVVAGVRFERTEDEGLGPLDNPRATFVQDSQGRLVLDSEGDPIPLTNDPLERAVLRFTDRGATAKRSYSGYYPSLNLSYNITDNLIARAAYARTIGRPNFNTIAPGVRISDPEAIDPRITISNIGLKPWTSDGYDLMLEWYFGANSLVSVGAFRRNATDFFGTLVEEATIEQLQELGLGDEFLDHDIITTTNTGDATITGYEFAYRQALTFLPDWARGIQVFANATLLDLEGSTIADFSGFAETDLSWGVSLSRKRYSVKLNWLSKGEVRGRLITGANIPPETHFFEPVRTTLDASVEIRLSPKFTLYGTARNLTNSLVRRLRKGPGIPDFAQNERYVEPGIFATLGIKGEF